MDSFRSLLGIRRMDKVPNVQIRDMNEMKGLTKALSGGSALLKEWRMIGGWVLSLSQYRV